MNYQGNHNGLSHWSLICRGNPLWLPLMVLEYPLNQVPDNRFPLVIFPSSRSFHFLSNLTINSKFLAKNLPLRGVIIQQTIYENPLKNQKEKIKKKKSKTPKLKSPKAKSKKTWRGGTPRSRSGSHPSP